MKIVKFLSLLGWQLVLSSSAGAGDQYETEILAQGLDHPWSMAYISDTQMLVTELSGELKLITDGQLRLQLISTMSLQLWPNTIEKNNDVLYDYWRLRFVPNNESKTTHYF